MLQDTRITLLLLAELVAALRANDPDLFKRWLVGGIEDLGQPAVTELMTDWITPLLTQENADRLVGWHNAIEEWETMVKTGWGRCRPPMRLRHPGSEEACIE